MKFFETSKYYSLKKSIYINLRWIGIIGQIISIYFVYFYLQFKFIINKYRDTLFLKNWPISRLGGENEKT